MNLKQKAATGVFVLAGLFGGATAAQAQNKDVQPQSKELLAFNDNAKPTGERAKDLSFGGERMTLVVTKGTNDPGTDEQTKAFFENYFMEKGLSLKPHVIIDHHKYLKNMYDIYMNGHVTEFSFMDSDEIREKTDEIVMYQNAFNDGYLEELEKQQENTLGQLDAETPDKTYVADAAGSHL